MQKRPKTTINKYMKSNHKKQNNQHENIIGQQYVDNQYNKKLDGEPELRL